MSEKKKPSGSEYRKRARERSEREDALLKKMPSLDSFFSKSKTTSNNDSSEPLLDVSVKSVEVESDKKIQVGVPSTSASTLNTTPTETFPEQVADSSSYFNVTDEKENKIKIQLCGKLMMNCVNILLCTALFKMMMVIFPNL